MSWFFDIFENIVDEKRCLKMYMARHHLTFLQLRDLFFDLQKDYREEMIFKWQDMGIVYERNFEIRVLKVIDWPIKRMVEDENSFRQILYQNLNEDNIILNRNIRSSYVPEYFLL